MGRANPAGDGDGGLRPLEVMAMKVRVLDLTEDKVRFLIEDVDVAFANADINLNAAYAFTGQAAATTPKQGYTYAGGLIPAPNSVVPLAGGTHNLPASPLDTSSFAFTLPWAMSWLGHCAPTLFLALQR